MSVFLLRGIEHKVVYNNYIAGKYSNVTDIPKEIELVNLATTSDVESITFRNRSNTLVTIITNNHHKVNKCLWCRDELKQDMFGIPIKMIFEQDKVIFFMDRVNYCSPECVCAEIRHEAKRVDRNIHYTDSEVLLYTFCRYIGIDDLKPAPDWWLLDINGGPLRKEEFIKCKYIPNPNLLYREVNLMYSK
jgi:hypothetical protein